MKTSFIIALTLVLCVGCEKTENASPPSREEFVGKVDKKSIPTVEELVDMEGLMDKIDKSSIPKGWAFIAGVDGGAWITHVHVRSLLKSHGIDCGIWGGIVCDVIVPSEDRAKAVTILKEDLKKHHYNITLHTEGKFFKYTAPEKKWRESSPKMKYQELIGLELYGPTTNIGALLRAPEVRKEIAAFPYVVRIKSHRREYHVSRGNIGIGLEVEIELTVERDEMIGSKCLFFQVWRNGKEIRSMGSHEWGSVSVNQRRYDNRKEDTEPENAPDKK